MPWNGVCWNNLGPTLSFESDIVPPLTILGSGSTVYFFNNLWLFRDCWGIVGVSVTTGTVGLFLLRDRQSCCFIVFRLCLFMVLSKLVGMDTTSSNVICFAVSYLVGIVGVNIYNIIGSKIFGCEFR